MHRVCIPVHMVRTTQRVYVALPRVPGRNCVKCVYWHFILPNILQEGLRCGGLTPASAPRMPVIYRGRTIGKQAVNAIILPRGTYIINKSCLNEKKENTGWNQIQ